ncbi:MAG: multiprotein-bridging factor 1 family protein [Nanoarchaeota archaeon]
MASCEMCGRETNLVKCRIESTIMEVCAACGRHGTVLSRPAPPRPQYPRAPAPHTKQEEAVIEEIVPNFAAIISSARQRLNLKQDDLGKLIAEKVSVIHAIETGRNPPGIPLARKLERHLHIKLVERKNEDPDSTIIPHPSAGTRTIGDLLSK